MRLRTVALLIAALLGFTSASRALTMEELRAMPGLTPTKFAKLFASFEYKFHPEVQPHNQFLSTKSGDCDDFATVAADALSKHGYTPRMIAIRMKGETHVVCYIPEERAYLDYNTRKERFPLVSCDPDITHIAAKVSAGFERDWIATYEFTYDEHEDVKRLVAAITPNPAVSAVAAVSGTERSGAKR